jgi:hypothetical protein
MATENEDVIAPEAGPSIREELSAAIGVQNANTIPVAAPEAPAETKAPTRAADGKFAKAAEAEQTPPLEPNAPAAAEPLETGTIRPPASWSATAKADFASLAPHIQQEVLKREGEIEGGKAQWDQKAARFNRLDAVLGPRQERFQLQGIDEVQAVQSLLAAQDYLDRDAPAALQYLAKQYGVDLSRLAPNAQQQPQQAQLPPVVQQMAQKIATLEQTLSQQQSVAHQQAASETQSQIDAFAADPANLYFANVRGQMAVLSQAEPTLGLKDLYDRAVWANPEIRPLLLRDQQQKATAELEQQTKARAEAARRAGGSITGSPSPGSGPAGAGPASSLRGELERQFSAGV